MDYFLVSESLFQHVTEADIIAGYRTDYNGITLKLKLIENIRGKGYWKFNNSLLKDNEYIDIVKQTIIEVKDTYKIIDNIVNANDNIRNADIEFDINDQLFFEILMMIIRGNTIRYSAQKKKTK